MASFTHITKRNGQLAPFDQAKIVVAVSRAMEAVTGRPGGESATRITETAVNDLATRMSGRTPGVEDVQNSVERALMAESLFEVAKAYIIYRWEHSKVRAEEKIQTLQKVDAGRIYITNLDGSREVYQPSKLKASIEQAVGNLAPLLDLDAILEQVRLEMYEDMKISDLKRAAIMVMRSYIERDPAYSYGAARLLRENVVAEVVGEGYDFARQEEQLEKAFVRSMQDGVAAGRLDPRLLTFDLAGLAKQMTWHRDNLFDYLGMQTLVDRYLLRETTTKKLWETPQMFWMRVAMGLALGETDRNARALEFYEVASKLEYVPGSPTLFHAGTHFSQLSSCFLNTVPDDLHQIFKTYSDNAQLLKFAGGTGTDWTPVRGTGAVIKAINVESQGLIPFLKIANDVTISINRSGRRRGAACAYLETWHWDIEEFLELRKNTGDERRRTHDMNTANWVPDLFMQRVKEDGQWSLFSPDEVPDLHDLYGRDFAKRYQYYEQQGKSGKLNLFRQMPARELWRKMLTMLFETGHPWVTFKDPSNIRSPQDHVGVVHNSNLCTEITLNTSSEETAVCNLGSINLAKHITAGKLDQEKVARTVATAMRMLDNVIDLNFYPTPETKRSNLRHRPVGLGIMGFHDALYLQGIDFDSEAMVDFADQSQELIAYHAILASSKLAAERGSYASFRGSKWDRGLLPQDTLGLLETERGQVVDIPKGGVLDWSVVRQHVREHGMRNSNCMAIAPTATISNIAGSIPSIEPIYKNIYVKSNISGDFVVVNEYLVDALKQRGLWNDNLLQQLKFADGRLADIADIPADLKARFKEVFEIDAKWIVRAASVRGKWIDQSQSVNIFYAGNSGREIADIYMYAWDMGLKTTYYLRTLGASQVEKSTVSTTEFGATHTRKAYETHTAPVLAALVEAGVSSQTEEVRSETAAGAVAAVAENVPEPAVTILEVMAKTEVPETQPQNKGITDTVEIGQFKLCKLNDPDCESCQ